MQVYENEEMEPQFSDSEKYKNYLTIAKTAEYIQNGGRVTEDWVEQNKKLIRQWREWIPDFNVINQEVQDSEFRKTCQKTETLMSYMCSAGFDVKVYLLLLQHMKKLCDLIYDNDELEEMMKMMGV